MGLRYRIYQGTGGHGESQFGAAGKACCVLRVYKFGEKSKFGEKGHLADMFEFKGAMATTIQIMNGVDDLIRDGARMWDTTDSCLLYFDGTKMHFSTLHLTGLLIKLVYKCGPFFKRI